MRTAGERAGPEQSRLSLTRKVVPTYGRGGREVDGQQSGIGGINLGKKTAAAERRR